MESLSAVGENALSSNDGVRLAHLGLDVRLASLESSGSAHRVAFRAVTQVDFITTAVVGYGSDEEAAISGAAKHWVTGVHSVVHSWKHASHPSTGAVIFYMHVRDQASNKEHGWRVHISPQIGDGVGPHAALPDQDRIFVELFDLLRQLPARTHPLWMEASVTRGSRGEVEAVCLIQGQKWPSAEEAMKNWVRSWPLAPGAAVSVRQFLLLEPVSAELARSKVEPLERPS